MTLEEVLADMRGDAAVLRRNGDDRTASVLERFARHVAGAAEDYLAWLDESDARLQSGHGVEWLRARYPEWFRQGHARMNGRHRQYRQVVIPRRADPEAAREAGRQAGAQAA